MIHRFTFSAIQLLSDVNASMPSRVNAFSAAARKAGATRVSVWEDEYTGAVTIEVEAPEPVLQRLGASST